MVRGEGLKKIIILTLITHCKTYTADLFPLGLKLRDPNFTLKRTFKVENTGQLQIRIEAIEVSGYPCEGYGFKVVNCQEFVLSANASRDIIIL